MAEPKTYTEDEHIAILADRVATETAALTAKVAELESENASLKTAKETIEAAKAQVDEALATANGELATVTTERDELKKASEDAALEATKTERVAKVKGLTPEGFVTPEREAAYAEMEQAAFDELVATLEAGRPAGSKRIETAAFSGGEGHQSTDHKSVARAFVAAL